mgnify:CR=1 FL=1
MVRCATNLTFQRAPVNSYNKAPLVRLRIFGLPSAAQYLKKVCKLITPGGSMADVQPGILAPLPRLGRYLNFSLKAGAEPRQTLPKLIDLANGNQTVVGLDQPAVLAPKTASPMRYSSLPSRFQEAISGVRR